MSDEGWQPAIIKEVDKNHLRGRDIEQAISVAGQKVRVMPKENNHITDFIQSEFGCLGTPIFSIHPDDVERLGCGNWVCLCCIRTD